MWQCLFSDNLKRSGFDGSRHRADPERCEGLDQAYRRDYLEWLRHAVNEKIPGAAVQYLTVGPNGVNHDLEIRANDPLVVEWKKTAIDHLNQATKDGDSSAAMTLSNVYSNGIHAKPDVAGEVGYLMAAAELRQREKKNVTKTMKSLIDEQYQKLSEEEKAKAKQIFKEATDSKQKEP